MFKVYDNYEMNMELLGTFETKKEVNKCIKEREADTDGECYIIVKEINTFIDDVEKMADFKVLSKDEFLQSYSYISELEYDNTATTNLN